MEPDLSRLARLELGYQCWLTTVRFDHAIQQIVFQESIHAIGDVDTTLA
jgi:hypothetical protein